MNDFETTLLKLAPESVLSGIPQHLLDIPREITERTGIHVQVLPLGKAPMALATGVEPAPLLLDINVVEQSITILCGQSQPTSAMIGHGLIRLRRAVLESIPTLVPDFSAPPEIASKISQLENELENVFVLPEEFSVFPSAKQDWADHYRKMIQAVASSGSRDVLCIRWAQIRNSLPEETEIAESLAAHIRSHGDEWVKYSEILRMAFGLALKQGVSGKETLQAFVQGACADLRTHMGTSWLKAENGYLGFKPFSISGGSFADKVSAMA